MLKNRTPRGRARHGLGFELPAPIARLDELIAEDEKRMRTVEEALGIAYVDKWVGARSSGDFGFAADAGELGYVGHPFEIVPFAWQGGDGLQFAMLVHAGELAPSCPIVSYAPVDDGGPLWLGDDAAEGVANLMGIALRDAGLCYDAPEERDDRQQAVEQTRAASREIARALRVTPSKQVRGFTAGARAKAKGTPKPAVPPGWRWVASGPRTGELAPKALFDPKLGKHELPRWPEAEPELARARDALKRGFPASALAIARNVYKAKFDQDNIAAAAVMREAYERMGRKFLAARVDAYLAQHAGLGEKKRSRRR